jgi:hypothetical protein
MAEAMLDLVKDETERIDSASWRHLLKFRRASRRLPNRAPSGKLTVFNIGGNNVH